MAHYYLKILSKALPNILRGIQRDCTLALSRFWHPQVELPRARYNSTSPPSLSERFLRPVMGLEKMFNTLIYGQVAYKKYWSKSTVDLSTEYFIVIYYFQFLIISINWIKLKTMWNFISEHLYQFTLTHLSKLTPACIVPHFFQLMLLCKFWVLHSGVVYHKLWTNVETSFYMAVPLLYWGIYTLSCDDDVTNPCLIQCK